MTRCPECRARIRDEAVTCNACGADLGEPLTVLDLDDPEIGVRPEDRFAAIPPGPRIVPRRVHDESNRAPILLLSALVAFFLIAAVLGGAGSSPDEPGSPNGGPVPVLDQRTDTKLLLLGSEGAARFSVDNEHVRTQRSREFEPLVDAVSGRGRFVPSTVDGRVWFTASDAGVSGTAQELDLATGSPVGPPVEVDGFVVGAVTTGLIVERHSGALEIVGRDGSTVDALPEDRLFVAAGDDQLATRSADCTGSECDVEVENVETGTTRTLSVQLGSGGIELASFSPDGQRLMVARSDGVNTRGVIVDVSIETVARFRSRAARRDSAAPLAWSPDGAWLFVVADHDELDVIGPDGQEYRVEAELPPFEAALAV